MEFEILFWGFGVWDLGFFCYIVECVDGTLYTGWTTDVTRRVKMHNAGRGAKYTRMHRPVRLVYSEKLRTRSAAQKRELEIKRMPRAKKIALIKKLVISNQ